MTAPQLPEPLVPPDVDLSGYEFMPLFGERLFKSETWIGVSAEAKLAALRLWWHSYAHEVPAASLPDNDQFLADYAGYGAMIKAWRKVKPAAMRGFVLCSDGRWYHQFLSTVVMSAWEARRIARAKGQLGATKRWGKHKQGNVIAQASGNDGRGTPPAIEKAWLADSKGEEGTGKGGDSTISTRVDTGQGRLKNSLKSKADTPPDERSVDDRRELARKIAAGEIKVGT